MAALGKTVRIYLADGTATGIRHAEVVNWSGQAIVCPRGRVSDLADWEQSQRPGVYVLLGEDSVGSKPAAYIGETENVLTRLKQHVDKKDFWNQVVFFTSKDDNLTKSHVKYLESRMVSLAQRAGRAALENGNVPQIPTLPRPDRDAMEEFLESVQILLPALGFPLLRRIAAKNPETGGPEGPTGPLAEVMLSFTEKKKPTRAQGASTDEGFVVFAGSKGRKDASDSVSKGAQALRQRLIDEGRIAIRDDSIEFVDDVLFSSPSMAAAVVCGGSRNGREVWKTDDGRRLKDLEEALLAATAEAEQA